MVVIYELLYVSCFTNQMNLFLENISDISFSTSPSHLFILNYSTYMHIYETPKLLNESEAFSFINKNLVASYDIQPGNRVGLFSK